MVNLLLAYDEEDERIGNRFKALADITKMIFSNVNILELSSRYLKNDILILEERKKISVRSAFIAFTHGQENALIGSKDKEFLSSKTDVTAFKGDLMYCFSCLAGITLSKYLIGKGIRCFIGHNKVIYVHTLPRYSSFFEKPVKCFISNVFARKSIERCLQETKHEYTQQIDALYGKDYMLASCLLNNRDSLIALGDKSASLNDYDL